MSSQACAPLPKPNVQESSPLVRQLTFSILLVSAGLIAYENSMFGVFAMDDLPCIVNNPPLRSLSATWSAGREEIPGGLRRRIIGRWTFALNYAAGGLNVWGYHLVNITIHIVAALLLMGVVRQVLLLPQTPHSLRQHSSMLAFCVALLWLVHPIQTESVTYIVQRLESLMGMFFLASLYSLVRSHTSNGVLWQGLAVLSGLLCIGTKEVGVMLPIVTLVFDRVFLASSWKDVFRRRGLVHLCLFAMMFGYFVVSIGKVPYYAERRFSVFERPTSWEFLRTQPGVLLYYLGISFWPRDFCLDLGWKVAHDPWEIYGKGALILATLVTGFSLLYRCSATGFLIVSFFLILAPSSTIVPLKLAFVHRMYLPLACVAIGLTLSIFCLAEFLGQRWRFRSPSTGAAIIVVAFSVTSAIGLTSMTRQHNEVYDSRMKLWEHALRVAPHNDRRHIYYGLYLHNELMLPERALSFLRKAVELKPDNATYHFALAAALEDNGDAADAESSYRRAIDLKPDYYEPYHNLGRMSRAQHRFADARSLLTRAIEVNPTGWLTHRELARLAIDEDKHLVAVKHYKAATRFSNGDNRQWIPKRELAWLLATSPTDKVRDGQLALRLAKSAVKTQPTQAVCWDTLAAAQAELRQFDDAIASCRKALQIAVEASKVESSQILNERIKLYRQRLPYRTSTTNPAHKPQ